MKTGTLYAAVIIVLLFSQKGRAQNYAALFEKGKQELKAANYARAMLSFRSCMVYDKANPYELYANYYYALSAYRRGWHKISRETLFALGKSHPKWNQMDEVHFLTAKNFSAEKEYFEAFKTLKKISNPDFASRIEALKKSTVEKIEDAPTLEMLLEDYKDPTVADALVNILNQPSQLNRRAELVNEYRLKYAPPSAPAVSGPIYAAALLPFLTKTLNKSPTPKKNQQILDLYIGMRMAADSLKQNKIDVRLLAYDTRRDSVEINRLLALDELKAVSLLVGPLFKEGLHAMQRFSNSRRIPLVPNPMSADGNVLRQPYTFLFQPSFETKAKRSAEFLAAHTKAKYCAVYYGEAGHDSLQARVFAAKARELGIKTIFKRKVNKRTSSRILSDLTGKIDSVNFIIKRDSIGGVYVASDDPLVFMQAVNAVEARREDIWVLGDESWFNENNNLISKFSTTKTAFASPNLINISAPKFRAFEHSFLKAHGKMPSLASYIGFEFMYTFGSILNQDRNFFQKQEVHQPTQGRLNDGYLMQPSRDNGLVPFGRFRNGEYERIQNND